MNHLKLLALDEEDLSILSAHVQDSVLKVGDVSFAGKTGVFTAIVNRFVWEAAIGKTGTYERRRALLSFKRVRHVRSQGFDRRNGEEVLDILALSFEQIGDGPEGVLQLVLAGGGAIALDVECIEGQLADTGGAWETTKKPEHPLES